MNISGQGEVGVEFSVGDPLLVHYRLTEESMVADSCPCDPEQIASFMGNRAAAEFCIMRDVSSQDPGEVYVDIEVTCQGPKKRFLGRKRWCGADIKIQTTQVTKGETDDREAPLSEIAPGVTISSIIQGSIDNPDRQQEHEGLMWGDKIQTFDGGVRPGVHVAVGSRDGQAVEVDINQAENPFNPARIGLNLSGEDEKLTIIHREAARAGDHVESFSVGERAKFDERVTELFSQYFMY